MTLTGFKIVAALSILCLTAVCGLLPLKISRAKEELFIFGENFASGVFLSAAFLDLLPNAENGLKEIHDHFVYPVIGLVCVITFMFLFFLERGANHYREKKISAAKNSELTNLIPFILVLVLSIHALIEGAAIGMNFSLAGSMILFLAVIAHKGSESFALTANLSKFFIPRKKIFRTVSIFSTITPIGILIASTVGIFLYSRDGVLTEAIFNAVAAGTFFYLGTSHLIAHNAHKISFNQTLALIFGITLMSIVTIWV
jgi:solute carrier family 39 (zinc transporter), member 1/2/3